MTCTVIAIRPEPGCTSTAEAGRELGLTVRCHPLFAIEPVAWDVPFGPFDGLLIGSANALRHGGPAVDKLADIPAYVVGEATAAATAERGIQLGMIGSGGLQAVLDKLAGKHLRLLRLSGEERVELDPPPGIEIVEAVLYRSVARPFPGGLFNELAHSPLVLLHSAAAARHFSAECDRLSIARDSVALAALGPRIAAAAGAGWRRVESAAEPTDPALLALAREMCHEPFPG